MKIYLFFEKRNNLLKNKEKNIIFNMKKASKILILLAFLREYYIISKYNREL